VEKDERETMEAEKSSETTDGKGYCFTARGAASVSVGVLLVTALACAGEPAGRDPNNRPIVVVWPADSRNGSAHKDAAEVLLGRDYDNPALWHRIHGVTGLGGLPDTEPARQNAETIVWHCQRALALGVKDEEVYWMLGEGYFLQKQYREAIDAARGALQVKPDFYPALHLLIRSHSRAGEYEKALDYCVSARATHLHGISAPHSHYFYSLCRRLTGAGRYAAALSYYEKWAELSSKTESVYRRHDDDLAKEMSHVKYYLTSPIKGYPPTVAIPRIGVLSAEEAGRLLAPLQPIAGSCSSPNIAVSAVSIEKKGILSRALIAQGWLGAINGEVGALEIEFKGRLKSVMGGRTYVDFEPPSMCEQINRTKAEAIKGFLQQAAPHLGIPEYVVKNLTYDEHRIMLVYSQEPTHKGVPLRIHDRDRPGFEVNWYGRELRMRDVFSIHNSLYPFPPADIPVEPLVAERQAREIATQALKDKHPIYPGARQERLGRPPGDGAARSEFRIDEIALVIEPEFLSFHSPWDRDLFDPVYDFAEHRLAWIALDNEAIYQVKVDAITGEVLMAAYWGPIE
jgi:tetratricopeptide (TPR) repeat protein